MNRYSIRIVAALIVMAFGAVRPALGHHPGHRLDEVMGSREQFFQTIGRTPPDFRLEDADGRSVRLGDFAGKVVVLFFVYASCGDICPLHAERIAEVQKMVNITPMKDLVQFVAVSTDPRNDTGAILRDYGELHGLAAVNWMFLTTTGPEDGTRKLAEAYGHRFDKTPDGYQMHGIVTHIIDRSGQWRANFHGLRFAATNLLQYINGLTNEPPSGPR